MSNLKQRVFLVLGIIALGIGCTYFITGKIIQKNYYETIAKLNINHNIKVNLLNYKRGLINSHAKLEIALVDAGTPVTIPMQQTITHGPLIAANTPEGFGIKILVSQIKTFVTSTESKTNPLLPNPLTLVTLVDFANEATTWIKMSPVKQNLQNGLNLATEEIRGTITHDLTFTNYNGTINLPQIQLHTDDWQLTLAELILNLDAQTKDSNYSQNNSLSSKSLAFKKQDRELIKLDDVSAILTLLTKENNLTLDLAATVAKSRIINQEFAQDILKLQANNLSTSTLGQLATLDLHNPKEAIDSVLHLTGNSTNVTLELPKHFTEALLAYVSFEVYRSSTVGRLDRRPEHAVLRDITGSINNLVQGAVKQQLFMDKGAYYTLNFKADTPLPSQNQG